MDSWMDAVGLGCHPTGEWRKADGTDRPEAADGGDFSLLAPPHYSPGERLSSPLSDVDEVFRHWGADGVLWDQVDFARPAADLSFAAAIAFLGMVYGGCVPVREQPSLSKARENRLPDLLGLRHPGAGFDGPQALEKVEFDREGATFRSTHV